MLKVSDVRCCGLKEPVGLDKGRIEFSWKLESDERDVVQSTYQIVVTDVSDGAVMWDSKKVEDEKQNGVLYEGEPLKSNREYSYEVTVTDNHGNEAGSEAQTFTMGLYENEWKAKWIGCQSSDLDAGVRMATKEEMVKSFLAMMAGDTVAFTADRKLDACNIYRKEFEVKDGVRKSWLSITAHGLYEARINGRQVTDTCFNPGFTAYDKYLEYQTYDVTELLCEGTNVLTIVLADGWYKGKFGILGYGNNYGVENAVLAQMELQFEDGTAKQIVTDETFEYAQSAFVYSDILIGEKQDGRIDMEKYYRPGTVSGMKKAQEKQYGYENLHGICCEPVRCTEIIRPQRIFETPKGELIADMGQNIVGTVRISVQGDCGTEIKLEHSEVLDKEGNFINNVSGVNRDQTDYYILRGKEPEIFEPRFTFHGFRYVKISGYPGVLTADKIEGIVLGSDLEKSGEFSCSNPELNRLQSNIMWSQRGNMLSIPTDCPQRERAGWTGDILVYAKTAAYNQNVRSFLKKWLRNMEKEQFEDGLIPVVIPYPLGYSAMQKDAFGTDTSAGWGDAAIIVPWTLYEIYQDETLLKDCFGMMKKWMDYVEKDASEHIPEHTSECTKEWEERQKYLWNTGFHFGDWCYPSCKNERGETDMFRSAHTTKEHVATAMYAHSADVMSKVCSVLGEMELAEHYRDLNGKIRKAFSDEYVKEDGSIEGSVQGIYVLAIAMKMAEGDKLGRMAAHLAEMIRENGNRLDTGFLSIEYLLDVLVEYGYEDVASKLLYQEKCPSWLYEVKNGATTMWETWNAILEDGTRTDNSYNHYAFGCVGDWMYRNLLGITRTGTGYRRFRIEPSFRYGLTEASGSYESVYGRIGCSWKLSGKQGVLSLEVPVGTSAEIVLPGISQSVGSGTYEIAFSVQGEENYVC